MPQSYVLSALTEKRAELSGIIADLETRIRQVQADLAHIDATLRLFDPDARPADIRAKDVSRPRSGYFRNGEISRRCLDAIRVAGKEPISAESIVRQTMTEKGLDPEDKNLRQDFIQRFLWALHRMQRKAVIQRVGRGLGSKWTGPAD